MRIKSVEIREEGIADLGWDGFERIAIAPWSTPAQRLEPSLRATRIFELETQEVDRGGLFTPVRTARARLRSVGSSYSNGVTDELAAHDRVGDASAPRSD